MAKLSVRDLDVRGKRVLVRVDFNVPTEVRGRKVRVSDDTRIRESLPTINYLREHGAKTILMSHFGRPKGKPVGKYSLRPIGEYLHSLIHHPVIFSHDTIGDVPKKIVEHMENGDVALLENVRFQPGEEANDPEFAKALSELGDLYVNDAFGAAHRAHASTVGITKFVEKSGTGLLMEKELKHLRDGLENPARPFVVILGGAKVSDKIGVLKALMEKANTILIGGAMANTFLKAEGFNVGESLVEDDYLAQAKDVMRQADEKGVKLLLPADVIVAERFAADSPARRVSVKDVPEGWRIMDVGETTIDVFARALQDCRMVVWNGPMGVIEMAPFAHGSHRLAGVIANLGEATTIIGGGETAAVVEQVGLASRFSHVSTGGGASLEFLEGKELPGVAALMDA